MRTPKLFFFFSKLKVGVGIFFGPGNFGAKTFGWPVWIMQVCGVTSSVFVRASNKQRALSPATWHEDFADVQIDF